MRRQVENIDATDKKDIKNTRYVKRTKDKKKKKHIGLKVFIVILVILRNSIWNISKKST
jgi:hypothetical protein